MVPRKLTKHQRDKFNKRLSKAKAICGEPWLPLEEYRRLKKERETDKNFVPPLPATPPYKPPKPPVESRAEKGSINPEVFKGFNLDAKITLLRRSFCKH